MESNAVGKTLPWVSFYVFISGSMDEFLIHYILPYLETSRSDVKRFFFIRHSEGGMHLRLRFMPRSVTARCTIAPTLNSLAERFAGDQGNSHSSTCTVQEMPYDRSLLYFGNNAASVYAELLNERTSALALRILSAHYQAPPLRFLLTVSALLVMYRLANMQSSVFVYGVEESLALARNAIARAGLTVPAMPSLSAGAIKALEQRVPAIVRQLEADDIVQRIGRLLRRSGQFPASTGVGTHALHLFCNKLGFPLPEELNLFGVVQALQRQSR